MRLGDFLIGIGYPVVYWPDLAPVCGSVNAVIVLCQLSYWHGRAADAEGWIYKNQAEFQAETGLSVREQETARRHLRERGILAEEKRGLPARNFYRIDLDQLDRLWGARDKDQRKRVTSDAESASLDARKTRHIPTEITTEITTEREARARKAGITAKRTSEARQLCGLFTAKPSAAMLHVASGILDRFAEAGRFAEVFPAAQEWAGKGYKWASFTERAGELLAGTAAPLGAPRGTGKGSGPAAGAERWTDAGIREVWNGREWREALKQTPRPGGK